MTRRRTAPKTGRQGSRAGVAPRLLLCVILSEALIHWSPAVELQPRDFAVELTATVSVDPPEIRLNWRGDPYSKRYWIKRKLKDEKSWTEIGTAEGPATEFSDREVRPGIGYEYQVIKEGAFAYTGYGYIYSGILVPLVEQRGRVILLVEAEAAAALRLELDRLEFDLIGDGWSVARRTVNKSDSVLSVKALVQSIYEEDPERTSTLFLFGHVPVPYSGNITPDIHENHRGAWPTDTFYGDLDGAWTDQTVNSTGAERPWNHNVPGDGKFDQGEIPSAMELRVGRVDLSNMTCFLNKAPSRTEIDLLRNYLNKDHLFRHALVAVEPRAALNDRIGLSNSPDPLAAMSWRLFAPFVGPNVELVPTTSYVTTVSSKSFLWTSVFGGGGFSHSDGVGPADAFALHDFNVVFATFLGSYFGDWDNESNFLRASLGANGMLLASVYAGQPQWIFHHLALGETLGYCAKITQENGPDGAYPPHNNGAGQVHINLHGDPTLRARPVPGVRNLTGILEGNSLRLRWEASSAPNLRGYYVYRSESPKGPFQRITPDFTRETSFLVENPNSSDVFMVRAVALTPSLAGLYFNGSQGSFYPDPFAPLTAAPPEAPRNLTVVKLGPNSVTLQWVSSSASQTGVSVERRAEDETEFREIAAVSPDTLTFEDAPLPRPGGYAYRVRAFNLAGASPYSNETEATTLSATAEFAGIDLATRGDWMGRYGVQGHVLPGLSEQLPPRTWFAVSNVFLYLSPDRTNDRSLQMPGSSDRTANAWVFAGRPFALHLGFTDAAVHQVSLYGMSWNRQSPPVQIEALDAVTGASLDRREFSTEFNEGVYVIYNVRRQVYFRVTPPSYQTNAEIYGVFIDPAAVGPVQITPAGGTFAVKTLVSIECGTPGAEIHFTLDGSEPTRASFRFSEPFWLSTDARIRARAFRDGYLPSGVTEAGFVNSIVNRVAFLRWDDQTGGDWRGAYGAAGYWIAKGGKAVGGLTEIAWRGASEWTWRDSTEERRALFSDLDSSRRVAATWFAKESMDLEISVYDTQPRAVALYFMDWDDGGRIQEIELIDSNDLVLEKMALEHFRDGRYLVFALQGQIRVRLARVQGVNALLNGIFLDPAPSGVFAPPPIHLGEVRFSGDYLFFGVAAGRGLRFCVDQSKDLQAWSCWLTNVVSETRFEVQTPMALAEPRRFFRAHWLP